MLQKDAQTKKSEVNYTSLPGLCGYTCRISTKSCTFIAGPKRRLNSFHPNLPFGAIWSNLLLDGKFRSGGLTFVLASPNICQTSYWAHRLAFCNIRSIHSQKGTTNAQLNEFWEKSISDQIPFVTVSCLQGPGKTSSSPGQRSAFSDGRCVGASYSSCFDTSGKFKTVFRSVTKVYDSWQEA